MATTPDALTTRQQLRHKMQPSDLLVVLGGDGTLNTVVSAVLQAGPDERPTVLPTRVGTANDFVRNHNGNMRRPDAIARIVRQGARIAIKPLVITAGGAAAPRKQWLALNNAGFGFTADAADALNTPAHRAGRWQSVPLLGQPAQEALTGYRSMRDLQQIRLLEIPGVHERELLDLSLIHARTAAKYGKFPVSHLSETFFETTIETASRGAVLAAASRMMRDKAQGVERTSLQFLTGDAPIRGQVDGETFTIAPHSMVRAALGDESFTTYSLAA